MCFCFNVCWVTSKRKSRLFWNNISDFSFFSFFSLNNPNRSEGIQKGMEDIVLMLNLLHLFH